MYKLLKAGFFRLKKDIIFWLFIFLTIGIAGITLFRYNSSGNEVILDKVVNELIMYIGLFIAIFVSIFVGKEHSEGIIKNKIIVGHSRTSIYLSNLIISVVTSILCELIYITIVLLIGIPLFGELQMPISQFAMTMLDTSLIIIAYCSIFNLITMLCSEITISTTVSILIFIAMFVIEASIGYVATCPKYSKHSYWENGIEHIISQELNPNYPGDQKVKLAKTIYLFIPQGQASEIVNSSSMGYEDTESLYQMPIYSIILISAINICGIYLFSRKELK